MTVEFDAAANEYIVRGHWPDIDDARLQLLLRRWAEWRGNRLAPPRSAVDPASIIPCLPELWIFRLSEDRSHVVCSLAGDKLNEAWGFSIMGKTPMELWGPEQGGIVNERLKRVALIPAIVHGTSSITPVSDLPGTRLARRLMLPLCDDAGAPYGAIGLTLLGYDRRRDQPQAAPLLVQAWRHPCADLPPDLPPL
ncbi:PAS domain-containing protein [Ferrovibrio sp.]|uniref:PAS domain-containing protein n=1 Tax=Ferrovibrio sp. TaxID=1917215 RepID=UPI002618110A|nr:PAS domain-containing protein [Ferrovibrio sp.]